MSTTPQPFYAGEPNLLNPDNHVLVLIDHQPSQFAVVSSHDRTLLMSNVAGLAKVAKIFGVPTLLTTVVEDLGGKLLPQIQQVFPDQEPINRTTLNSWEDPRVVDWVRQTGRNKVVIAGLWTEICVAFAVLSALGDGYEVYFVTDASGGATTEAHERAVQRMIQAGAVPLTWLAYGSELQRDWARTEHLAEIQQLMAEHGGVTGSNAAWEVQLLGTPTPEWVLQRVPLG
jgi:nicotinamidase-related amidase